MGLMGVDSVNGSCWLSALAIYLGQSRDTACWHEMAARPSLGRLSQLWRPRAVAGAPPVRDLAVRQALGGTRALKEPILTRQCQRGNGERFAHAVSLTTVSREAKRAARVKICVV